MSFPFPTFIPIGAKKSLRVRASTDANLSRTFGTPTDAKKYTYSLFVKRFNTAFNYFMSAASGISDYLVMGQEEGIGYALWDGQAGGISKYDNGSYGTTSASDHVHFLWSVDIANGTAANRVKCYVDNVELTSVVSDVSNTDYAINKSGNTHYIGNDTAGRGTDLIISNVHFIDGQNLTPSSFAETVGGAWVPKQYAGTYGNNGFRLNFSNGTSATTLGYDSSGNGNNFTPYGIATTDQLNDIP